MFGDQLHEPQAPAALLVLTRTLGHRASRNPIADGNTQEAAPEIKRQRDLPGAAVEDGIGNKFGDDEHRIVFQAGQAPVIQADSRRATQSPNAGGVRRGRLFARLPLGDLEAGLHQSAAMGSVKAPRRRGAHHTLPVCEDCPAPGSSGSPSEAARSW